MGTDGVRAMVEEEGCGGPGGGGSLGSDRESEIRCGGCGVRDTAGEGVHGAGGWGADIWR